MNFKNFNVLAICDKSDKNDTLSKIIIRGLKKDDYKKIVIVNSSESAISQLKKREFHFIIMHGHMKSADICKLIPAIRSIKRYESLPIFALVYELYYEYCILHKKYNPLYFIDFLECKLTDLFTPDPSKNDFIQNKIEPILIFHYDLYYFTMMKIHEIFKITETTTEGIYRYKIDKVKSDLYEIVGELMKEKQPKKISSEFKNGLENLIKLLKIKHAPLENAVIKKKDLHNFLLSLTRKSLEICNNKVFYMDCSFSRYIKRCFPILSGVYTPLIEDKLLKKMRKKNRLSKYTSI